MGDSLSLGLESGTGAQKRGKHGNFEPHRIFLKEFDGAFTFD
jgi:hypothetical protein